MRLLVVDDQKSDVDLLRHAFAKLGDVFIEHLTDAQQARLLLASPAIDHFDAVIFDWKMPGASGEELALGYLSGLSGQSPRPLVMMSSAFPQAAAKRLRSLGVLVIDKPMGLAAYYQAAQQILDHTQAPSQARSPAPIQATLTPLSLLEQLKRDTKPSHQQLESNLNISQRLQTKESYRSLLELFYGVYAAYGLQLQDLTPSLAPWLPNLPQRLPFRLQNLKQDLALAGQVQPGALRLAALTPNPGLPEFFGAMYVLEGSTLGGQVLARLILQNLNLTPENGAAFFAAYGQDTLAMWKAFCQALESYGAQHPQQRSAIIAGAQAAFERFDDWVWESA